MTETTDAADGSGESELPHGSDDAADTDQSDEARGRHLTGQQLKLGHSPRGGRGVAARVAALRRVGMEGGGRLLDIGCGSGPYTLALTEDFDHIDSVDIEPERLDELRAAVAEPPLAAKVTVREDSAVDLGDPDGTFDAVIAIETLEHVDDLPATLAELRRVTRPAGWLFITSPNRWFPIETHGAKVGDHIIKSNFTVGLPYVKPLHDRYAQARTFTATSLTQHLTATGWRVVAYSYVMPPFDGWKAGRKYLGPLMPRLERGPLGRFGVSVVLAARPDGTPGPPESWLDTWRDVRHLPRR